MTDPATAMEQMLHRIEQLEAQLAEYKKREKAVAEAAAMAMREAIASSLELCAGEVSWKRAAIFVRIFPVTSTRALDRALAKSQREELIGWPELCNGDGDNSERHARLCSYHRRLFDLDARIKEL